MLSEVQKLGRVSLIDLADTTGVDLYHVEKQARVMVAGNPGLMFIQGEIISQHYWDSVAEEVNERLQECSQIALAELAAQLHVGSELLTSVLEPRLGSTVKGRLEGGQLYTPAYVARVSAMVRGAARGISVPTNLSALWSSLQQLLQEMDGATGVSVEASFFQSLFNELLKGGEILGSLRAGVYWTPTVFAIAQKECVDSFFSQNSFIIYETLSRLGISQPVQFLQSRYPDGLPLANAFVHPSLTEMVDTAIEDAVERSSWIDSLSVLPASFGSQDASTILLNCPSVQSAFKSNKALILEESFVFSNAFIKDVYDRLEKEMAVANLSGSGRVNLSDDRSSAKDAKGSELNETSSESTSVKHAVDKGGRKKKGKSAGNAKSGATESGLDNQDFVPAKSKKNQKKSKDLSSVHSSEVKSSTKKDAKSQEENQGIPSGEWIVQMITTLFPDFEEQGVDDPSSIIRSLANHLRPMLINSWKEKRKAVFTENAERMKRLLDDLQKKIDEALLNIQLYEKALDLFEDDPSTSVVLHRHLLRTTAASIVDTLFVDLDAYNKLKTGAETENPENSQCVSFSSAERTALAKTFPGSLSKKALAVVDALEGKSVEIFMTALTDFAEESGLVVKKLDKKLERALLHSYRKDLTSQVSTEEDPISLLPKVVSLLYIQVHSKALQAPGRAISIAITRLKDKLQDSAYKILTDYQAATVTLLSLISASTGDEEDCTSERISSKRELLENLMPALKSVVLSKPQA